MTERRVIPWTSSELVEVTRIRMVLDPAFDHFDVEEVRGLTRGGETVEVEVPFDVLPRRGTVREIVRWARRDRVYFSDLTRHRPHAVLSWRVKEREATASAGERSRR